MYHRLNGCCGVCLVNRGPLLRNCDFLKCPTVRELFELQRQWDALATSPHVAATPVEGAATTEPVKSLCLKDLGFHHREDCPFTTEEVKERLKKEHKGFNTCANCGAEDKTFPDPTGPVIFHPNISGVTDKKEANTFGAKCSLHNGYHFFWHALWTLYHMEPAYVNKTMSNNSEWVKLVNTTRIPSRDEGEADVLMPSPFDFHVWARKSWSGSMRLSNGAILLLHFVELSNCDVNAVLSREDQEYWTELRTVLT